MKKIISTLVCLLALTMSAIPMSAQTRTRRYDNRNDRVYREDTYRNRGYRYDRDRSIWDKSRDKITTAGGAAGGAVLGGLIGGKKGAIIGAITGGAGAAIYTYKIRDKNRRRY